MRSGPRRRTHTDLSGRREIDNRRARLRGVFVRTPRDARQRQDNGHAGQFLQHGARHDAEMDTAVVPVVTWPVVSMTVTVTVYVPAAV